MRRGLCTGSTARKDDSSLTMKLSANEAKFLTCAMAQWGENQPVIAGVPLMFTDSTGKKVLLTSDEIHDLFDRIRAIR